MRRKHIHGNNLTSGHFQRGRLVKLLLLLLINEKPSHGYELSNELTKWGFATYFPPNMGPIYRALRELENLGFITSYWDVQEGARGPARRIYMITPLGKEILLQWIYDLKNQKALIDKILELYTKNGE